MSVITHIDEIKNKKRAEELNKLLMQLDIMVDKLYNLIEYDGILTLILNTEELRVRYYLEWYECDQAVKGRTDE